MPAPKPEPLRDLSDLLEPFHAAEKPRYRWRVGTEAEKFGVLAEDGSPLPFDGPRSIHQVFAGLVEEHGWYARPPEAEGGPVISLERGGASITLEPGGQVELSGSAFETVHLTCAEFRGHMVELTSVSKELGIAWLGVGFHPFARRDDMPLVPKLRYPIMREYLPTRGSMALDMMCRTTTVQANLDYDSETDAVRKLRVALRITPVVTAMFANSPYVERRASGEVSHRAQVWLAVDPDRTGLLPFVWDDDMSYRRYVEWALDVPMLFVKRGQSLVRNTGQTFRQFMRDGYQGAEATKADWVTHLNTVFPEVRLKNTLEVRGADGQSTPLVCALPALWKGLLYCDDTLTALERATEHLSYEDVLSCRVAVGREGLSATLAGRPVREWAAELAELAGGGLTRLSHLNRSGQDETVHLAGLRALVSAGRTPAEELLAQIEPGEDFVRQVIERARV